MKLVLACDPNGGIGYQNGLPWPHIQGDLPRFKELTDGQTIVMGRNTWDSLPRKPLPNRFCYIVTSETLDLPNEGAATLTWDEFIAPECTVKDSSTWLIGGAQLVNSCWEWVDEVHLTKTFTEYTCDTFIDLLYLESNYEQVGGDVYSDHEYQIWTRK